MKTLPAGLQTLLDTGATTLCTCWRIQRQDGAVFGFTNHDKALAFNATTFKPETGFLPSETASSLGLQVDTAEVEGALSSLEITDADIALGKWDNAACEIWRVDWSNAANRVILRKGSLGEVTRGAQAFAAEIRGLAHVLGQAKGRTYQRSCDAVVGDMRCGVNLNLASYKGTGAVASDVDERLLTVTGIEAFSEGWFAQGLLTWLTGANAGAKAEISGHRFTETGAVLIELWRRAERPVAAGHTFTVTAGCGKTWEICRAKFVNGQNFRGFPHMPGNDAAYQVVKKTSVNDGGSLFK
jgi:uncharacterized phage protein (TIGR02218 family)